MRIPVSDQQQLKHYLAPFNHNTSVTYNNEQTNGRTDDNRTKSLTVTLVRSAKR